MIPCSPRRGLSAAFAILLTALFLFGAGLAAQASPGSNAPGAMLQDATDYPYPDYLETVIYDYPVDTQEPLLPTAVDLTPAGSPTPRFSPTPLVNKFATEEAEKQDTLGTKFPSATAAPSITPVNTKTAQRTATATPALASAQEPGKSGFEIDWGFFWVGFAVPFLAACGVVLYLLDRRPDLFKFH